MRKLATEIRGAVDKFGKTVFSDFEEMRILKS